MADAHWQTAWLPAVIRLLSLLKSEVCQRVDTVPQKLQKTKLCQTPTMANETHETLLATS